MHTTINWTNPINWLTAAALLLLLVGQLWLLARNQSVPKGRKWLRLGLNLLLWLVLVGYFCQIQWPVTQPSSRALLVAEDVSSAFIQRVKDSLRIQDSFNSRTFKPDYDSVTLVGQRFPTAILTQLSNASVQWVPYNPSDQLQTLHWKGLVRQGEMQHATGRFLSSKNQTLRLRFGNQTLDSVSLHEGDNAFHLRFPAFAQGRSQAELVLGQTPLDTLRFFTRPTLPLTVQFILNNPDFESKTLADWLGKHGHTVQLSATLSKQMTTNVTINKASKRADKTVPDLIVTEPINANTVAVRKAIADGKAVLFINLTNPETECRLINQAVRSRWQVRKMSNEPLVPVGSGLNALPYRFTDNLNQFTVPGYPIAVQQTTGRVGVSLLSETYPLALSGDSLTYNRVWASVLARLARSDRNTVQVDAPVYNGIQQAISINNPTKRLPAVRIGQDTMRLTYSPINERLAEGRSLFSQAGWQPIQDTLALYVDDRNAADALAERAILKRFMMAHAQEQTVTDRPDRKTTDQLPSWIWLVLIVVCFTALWLEPKF